MVPGKKVAVLYHIFYEDTVEHLSEELKALCGPDVVFFFNLSSDMPNHLEMKEALSNDFTGSYVTISSNKGKDIGGKLLMLSLCMQSAVNPEWFIFLHDKKSLQALNAKTWKNDLLAIIDKSKIDKISTIIANSPLCGIIAANNYVRTESMENGNFTGGNAKLLSKLVKQYGIACSRYEYIAGTMFWIKAQPLIDFFSQHDPLKIREMLEIGNVVDNFGSTYTHSWERIFSWIVLSRGLNIKTV